MLVLAGLLVGLRILGADQFGISVMALAAGQLIAFPATAQERLVVRLVAQGDSATARNLMARMNSAAILAALATIAISLGMLILGRSGLAIFVAAVGATAVSSGLVALRQSANRASGHLFWGQWPNEVLRPAVTVLAYPVAQALVPGASGSASVLMASSLTLGSVLFAPRLPDRSSADPSVVTDTGSATLSLMVVSAVALAIERVYPLSVGALGGAASVAILTVLLRVIQMANFTQSFAIFYYSPALAAAVGHGEQGQVKRIARRVRAFSVVVAFPVAVICVAFPGSVGELAGLPEIDGLAIRLAAVAIVAQAIGGPSQISLILSGRESIAAKAYVAGAAGSLFAYISVGPDLAIGGAAAVAVAFSVWSAIMMLSARYHFKSWL
ncbi:hypothetical protein ACRTEC_01155 [Janibacter indicus]